MSCLDTLIGVDGSCASSTGRLYLSQVGMTEEKIANFLRKGDTTSGLVAKARAITSANVASDFLVRTASRIKPNTFLASTRVGEANQAQTLLTADANTIGGVVVETDLPLSNIKILLTSVSFWGEATSQTVTVYDLDDGSTVETFDLTTVADTVTNIAVDKTYQALRQRRRLFFTTDAATYYKVDIDGDCVSCGKRRNKRGGTYIFGARIGTSDAKKWTNLQRVSHTSGLGLTLSVVCDHAARICEVREQLALPILYKLCEELCRYGLFNRSRFNEDMTSEALGAEAQWYADKYAEEMDRIVGNMPLPDDPSCYVCNRHSRNVTMIP